MKRNLFALLLALVMITGCIFTITPAVFAETATDTTEDTTQEPSEEATEEPSEEPSEDPSEEPSEEPSEAPTETPTEEPTEEMDDTDAKAAKSPIPEPYKSILVFIIKFFKKLLAFLGL